MIRRTLAILVAVLIAALALSWVMSGGPSRALSSARTYANPLDFLIGSHSIGRSISLPWQLPAPAGPPITFSETGGDDADAIGTDALRDDYSRANENEYTAPLRADARDFGNPSPYIGRVSFASARQVGVDPAREFLTIRASPFNNAPTAISGWSLQSMTTGGRITIPPAAPVYVAGMINTTVRASLNPGDSAFIISGPSPVGVSFRENICSGYLAQFHTFVPPLNANDCPAPLSVPPSCVSAIAQIPPCHFPTAEFAPDIPPLCRSYAADTLSYNGCVSENRSRPEFARAWWRMYLASSVSLWRAHDTIRLLDERGRVVDVMSY